MTQPLPHPQAQLQVSVFVTPEGGRFSGIQEEYEFNFMRASDAFLTTYRNTLSYINSTFEVFFKAFENLSTPGELAYNLWHQVAKVKSALMLSSYLIAQQSNHGEDKIYGHTNVRFLVSEMQFWSIIGGCLGRALNILVVLLESSQIWRNMNGQELDLGANLLRKELDEAIDAWIGRCGVILGLSQAAQDDLRDRLLVENISMIEALYVEHFYKCKHEIYQMVAQINATTEDLLWDQLDFIECFSMARKLETRFKSKGFNEDAWKLFLEVMLLVPNVRVMGSKVHVQSLVKPSSFFNTTPPFRIIHFEHADKYLDSSKSAGITLVPGFQLRGVPQKFVYTGHSMGSPNSTLLYETFGFFREHNYCRMIPPTLIQINDVNEVKFYAALKSPIHLLTLYGGLVFSIGEKSFVPPIICAFDRGSDLLLRPPMEVHEEPILNPREVMRFTAECHLTASHDSVIAIPREVRPTKAEQLVYFGDSSLKIVSELFSMVSANSKIIDANGFFSQNVLCWEFVCLKLNSYTLSRKWQQNSMIYEITGLVEAARWDWLLHQDLGLHVL